MKKLLIMASAALLLASCGSDEYEAWSAPQSNSAETTSTVTLTVGEASAIDFNTVTADSVQLFVPKVVSTHPVASQSLTALLTYNGKTATLNASESGKVKSTELVSAVENLYGKNGDLHKVAVTVTDKVKLVRGEGFSLTQNVTASVTCVAPAFTQYLYMSGDANGWSFSNPLYSAAGDGKYTGFMYLNQNGFKFATQQDWNGTDYGTGLVEKGSNIVMTEPAGFYKVDVDLTSQALTYTAINRVGVIGSATAGGWDSDQAMTYNAAEKCWEIKGITLTEGEMKFRANNAWELDWGGSLADITYKGGNIKVAAGKYNIKLYLLCDTKSSCTMEVAP
ncbi:MAG: Outer membrane protein SusF domain-containing protein [Prevotella fusca]|uniref:Outer membrane protein SusF domain-containing protein n=1 Tax=Prevotella fusca TaxID=589436 RepID=UPI003F9F5A71